MSPSISLNWLERYVFDDIFSNFYLIISFKDLKFKNQNLCNFHFLELTLRMIDNYDAVIGMSRSRNGHFFYIIRIAKQTLNSSNILLWFDKNFIPLQRKFWERKTCQTDVVSFFWLFIFLKNPEFYWHSLTNLAISGPRKCKKK